MTKVEPESTEIRPGRRGSWKEAIWYCGLIVLAGYIYSRVAEHSGAILVLAVMVALGIFSSFLRSGSPVAVVTREEIRLYKQTIRRAEVARVARISDPPTILFEDADGCSVARFLGYAVFDELILAMRQHGWPEPE